MVNVGKSTNLWKMVNGTMGDNGEIAAGDLQEHTEMKM